MKLSSKYIFSLKIFISLLLIAWVVVNGDISLHNVKLGLSNLGLAFVFFILTFLQLLLGSFRTETLMQFKDPFLVNFKRVFSISWASSFINCIAPISLLGDFYRIKKLMGVDRRISKDNSIYTSIFSKLLSTFALVFLTILTGIIEPPLNKSIQLFYYGSSLFVIICITSFFFRQKIYSMILLFLERIPYTSRYTFLENRMNNLKTYAGKLIKEKKILLRGVLVSIAIQALNTASFILIIQALNPNIDVSIFKLIYVIPLGIFLMTLPVSFSGLGVGHIAFSKLLGVYSIANGADVFTIFFAFSFLFNLLGIIPFFLVVKREQSMGCHVL